MLSRLLKTKSSARRQPGLAFLALMLCMPPFITASFAQTTEPADLITVRSVQMPFDPADPTDSKFLSQLLLSHGLLLNMGERESIGPLQYTRLLQSISKGDVGQNPQLSDVRNEFKLSLLQGTSDSQLSDDQPLIKRPIEHRLVWWHELKPVRSEPPMSSATPDTGNPDTDAAITLIRQPDPAPQSAAPAAEETARPQVEPRESVHTPAPLPMQRPGSPQPQPPEQNGDSSRKKPLLEVGDDIPEGFAALSEPQFMFVDVYFNDEMLGSTGMTVTEDSIVFDEPEQLALLMSDVVTDGQLSSWLTTPLPTNGHLACYARNDPIGCGQINADPLAVIYNAILLRVDIFVKPSSQNAPDKLQPRYLEAPIAQTSAIFSVHGVASELSTGPSRLDLSGKAIVSYGRGNLSSDLQYNDDTDNTIINTLKLTHHLDNYDVTLGTFGFSPGGALNDLNLIGAGFSTSFKTRIGLEQAFSSQVNVYLPRRSVVQILIDDRIYSGASYAAGNQALDTTALPDGTYELEVIINDPVEGQRSERHLFTKSALIPPAGEWNISATLGALRQHTNQEGLPEISDTQALGLSAARRTSARSSYRLGIVQFDRTSVLQNEFLYLGEHLSLNAALSVGENSLRAASLQSSLRHRNHHFTFSLGHFSSSFNPAEDSAESEFFLPENTRANFSYHHALSWMSFGMRFGLRRELDLLNTRERLHSDTRTFSIYAQRPVLRHRHSRGFLSLRHQRDDEEFFTRLSLNMYFGKGAFRVNTGVALVDSSHESNQWQTRAAAGWKSDNLNGSSLSADTYITHNGTAGSYGLNTELKHPWFRASASSDFTRHENSQLIRNSIATFSAYAGIDRHGAGLGGSDYASSGLIVDVSGEPTGKTFDVMVNNAKLATARIGRSQFIGLQPFKHYSIKLKPNTIMGNGIGKLNHTVSLFPGNVGRIAIKAQRQVLLIAQVVDESGVTIGNAMAKSSSNTIIIDDRGILQAEVHDKEKLNVRRKDGSECQIVVDIDTTEEVNVPDKPVSCTRPDQ